MKRFRPLSKLIIMTRKKVYTLDTLQEVNLLNLKNLIIIIQ